MLDLTKTISMSGYSYVEQDVAIKFKNNFNDYDRRKYYNS